MSKIDDQNSSKLPEFIDMLSPEDRQLYDELRKNVGSPNYRYNRFRRISTLKDIFESIRKFCEHSEEDQWKRYFVCGICQFNNCIAINISHLKLLILKSKAVINGALVKMGYQTIPMKSEESSILLEKIPYLAGRYSELKHWTIRKNSLISNNEQLEITDMEDDIINEPELENKKDSEKNEVIDDPKQKIDDLNKNNKNENEFSFINFTNNNSSDFDYDFMNSDVYILMTNSSIDASFLNIENEILNLKHQRQSDMTIKILNSLM